jgi:hypothetical protein
MKRPGLCARQSQRSQFRFRTLKNKASIKITEPHFQPPPNCLSGLQGNELIRDDAQQALQSRLHAPERWKPMLIDDPLEAGLDPEKLINGMLQVSICLETFHKVV